MTAIENIPRDSSGEFPAFAWPGGYPVYYITQAAETLCAGCATAEYDSGNDTNSNPVVAGDVLWEGPPESCGECSKVIESAYGDPDTPEPEPERHPDAYEYGEQWGPDNPHPDSPWGKAMQARRELLSDRPEHSQDQEMT